MDNLDLVESQGIVDLVEQADGLASLDLAVKMECLDGLVFQALVEDQALVDIQGAESLAGQGSVDGQEQVDIQDSVVDRDSVE